MPQKAWVKPQKENRSFVDEAAAAIRSFAGSPEIGDRTKRLIEKAARHAGTTYSQAFDLWYRKASPKAAELFVRRVSNRAAEAVAGLSSEGFRGEDDARSEIENLKARIAQLEARVALAVQASASPVPFVGRPLAPEDSRTA